MSDFPEGNPDEPVNRPPNDRIEPPAPVLPFSGAEQPAAPEPQLVQSWPPAF
jgi:hypothetical protein